MRRVDRVGHLGRVSRLACASHVLRRCAEHVEACCQRTRRRPLHANGCGIFERKPGRDDGTDLVPALQSQAMTQRPVSGAKLAAQEALALRRSHPHAPALDVLDLVMPNRTGTLTSFGADIEPATPFGFLLAEAFDTGMAPEDWRLVTHPNTHPGVVAALRGIWTGEVVPKFAKRYGLTP